MFPHESGPAQTGYDTGKRCGINIPIHEVAMPGVYQQQHNSKPLQPLISLFFFPFSFSLFTFYFLLVLPPQHH